MPDPTQKKQQSPSIEMVLATHANDAISRGADPHAVTQRLGQMVQHLRAHPDVAAHANDAISQGADPAQMSLRVWQLASAQPTHETAPATPRGGGSEWGGDEARALPHGSFLAPVAEGLTLGGSGEAMGAIEGANQFIHGGSFKEGYQKGKAATDALNSQFAEENPKTSMALNVAGSLAPIALTGGAAALEEGGARAAVKAGAKYGAISGALGSDGGLTGRAKGAAKGAVIGAIMAPATEAVDRGVGNLLTRSGITDKAAKVIDKVSPKIAATMGTRGQVNRVFADRQDILSAIGASERSGAQQQMERMAATKAEAAKLYGAAKADKTPIDNPELNRLLEDPQVKRAYEIASQIREVSGNPLPRVSAPSEVPRALANQGVSQEQYQHLMELGAKRAGTSVQRVAVNSGIEDLPAELSGVKGGVSLPDPQVLSSLKRYLQNAAEGNMKSKFPIKQEEALALIPKLNSIRDILHETSPAWKKADAAFADAKGQEEAFAAGYDAVRNASSTVARKLVSHSPEAMIESINQPRYPSEPASAIQNRANAFRAGAKAYHASQVKGATIDRGLESVLRVGALEPTAKGAQVRALMYENPKDAAALEATLASKRGTQLEAGAPSAVSTSHIGRIGMLRTLVKPLTEPNTLNSPAGQKAILDRLVAPELTAKEIAALKVGGAQSGRAKSVIRNALAARAAR